MAGRLNWFHLIGSYGHYFAGITERSSADPVCVMCSARLTQPYVIYTPQETPKLFKKNKNNIIFGAAYNYLLQAFNQIPFKLLWPLVLFHSNRH